jgi:hypothetical protein
MRRSNGSATGALERAREELAQVSAQLGELASKRREALLHSGDEVVQRLDAQIEAAGRLQKLRSDRVSVLLEAAEQEAVARRAREQSALIARVEGKLAERDRVAAKLADLVAAADGALIELFALNRAIIAAWPWGNGHFGAVMLGDPAVLGALSNEIFRVGGRPPSTGGMAGDWRGPSYPGGKCENLSWIAMPERSSRPLVEKFAEATAAALVIMRTGKNDLALSTDRASRR